MSEYEEAIRALDAVAAAIGAAVRAVRSVDKLMPSQIRSFNGEVDDLHSEFAKLQPTRERLLQRSANAQSGVEIPPAGAAAALDGLR
jgi:hypothetical protein